MIKTIRVHTCDQRIDGYLEKRCTCRKYETQDKAQQLVDDGDADFIKISYKVVKVEVKCPICDGSGLKKFCNVCLGTGLVSEDRDIFEYGEDIFMTSAKKTPRHPTIEAKHIGYAYVKGDKDAAKRIELYHELDQLELVKLGAQLRDSDGEILFEGTPEPEDNPKKGEGRTYDYGRTI
jgi:hypothetical protein